MRVRPRPGTLASQRTGMDRTLRARRSRRARGGEVAGAGLPAGLRRGGTTPAPAGDTPRVHVVRTGDTLWDLAQQLSRRTRTAGPTSSSSTASGGGPGLILRASGCGCRSRGAKGAAVADAGESAGRCGGRDGGAAGRADAGRSRRSSRSAGGGAAVGSTVLATEAEAVPLVSEGDYHRAGLLVPEAEVTPVGRLAELVSPTVVPVRDPAAGAALRPGRTWRWPAGSRVKRGRPGAPAAPGAAASRSYGRIYRSTGLARVQAVDGQVATVVVEPHVRRRWRGRRGGAAARASPCRRAGAARADDGRAGAAAWPSRSRTRCRSCRTVAFVDLGRQSGVEEGDELVAVLPGGAGRRGACGRESVVARLRVVRVAARTATVRVIGLEHPALEAGLPVRRVGQDAVSGRARPSGPRRSRRPSAAGKGVRLRCPRRERRPMMTGVAAFVPPCAATRSRRCCWASPSSAATGGCPRWRARVLALALLACTSGRWAIVRRRVGRAAARGAGPLALHPRLPGRARDADRLHPRATRARWGWC